MDKEQLCYDLALIYARRMFGFYLQHQPKHEINKTESMTKKLFCFFEEAYHYYLHMDEREFRFLEDLSAQQDADMPESLDFNNIFPLFREK